MTALSSILAAHKGPDGRAVPRSGLGVETAVHWLHGLAALGWVVAMAVVTGLALPRVRALLTIEARRWFDARLENVILSSGVLTAVLLVTGFYNLKRSTPYPTPYLSAEPDRVLDLPDAKPYFYTLAVKLTVYVLMLIAAARIIRRAQGLAEGPDPREPRIERPAGEHGCGATAVLVESPPVEAKPAKRFLAPVAFGGGAALVLLCVSLLTSLHLKIEGTQPPPPDPLTAEHVEGAAPAFTKVVIAGAGANAWDITLTLADLHTQVPVSSVVVTVTGNGPDGAKIGPEDFTNLGEGRYRGRVSGPPGGWDLSAVAVDRAGGPPTQQTFTVRLPPDAPSTRASGSGS